MRLFLDICTGLGLSASAGIRPFLPALVSGVFAAFDVGVDYDGTDFAFLERAWFLAIVLALMAAAVILMRRVGAAAFESGPIGAAMSGVAIAMGGLLFAGVLADHGYEWWPGLLGGLAVAALAQAAVRSLFARVRARLDRQAQDALVVYADGTSAAGSALAIVIPPISIVLVGFLAWLLAGGRRRAGEKYAGLRILPVKLVLAVIDGCKPSMLERAIATGRAPALKAIVQRGVYVDDLVAAFPSVTPVCAASIATGCAPDRHHIPSMNWYSRAESRYVEYGSSFSASRRFGITRQLVDTVYNMNGHHLSPDVRTVFEQLDDADVRTAGTTYLMYRGRHRHEVARDTVLARAARTLFRHPVLGPRELFYADIFASRRTPCRSQLGLPGVRDKHTGCVGEFLVREDLFDFLLFSLPDNDTWSHKYGPHAQVESIAEADRQLMRMFDAGGGVDAFLDDHAMIVCADHSHAGVESVVRLHDVYEGFAILAPAADNAAGAEVAVCPAQRSAMVYALAREGRGALVPRIIRAARGVDGIDLVMWRTSSGEGAIAAGERELRFAPGTDAVDRRGERWSFEGDLEVLGGRVEDGRLVTPAYPDALGRVWSALTTPTAGDVLLSAAPGYEFADWGGVAHVGGGSHGSLHASDSLGVLAWCGTGPDRRDARDEWSLRDITPMIAHHFGVG